MAPRARRVGVPWKGRRPPGELAEGPAVGVAGELDGAGGFDADDGGAEGRGGVGVGVPRGGGGGATGGDGGGGDGRGGDDDQAGAREREDAAEGRLELDGRAVGQGDGDD